MTPLIYFSVKCKFTVANDESNTTIPHALSLYFLVCQIRQKKTLNFCFWLCRSNFRTIPADYIHRAWLNNDGMRDETATECVTFLQNMVSTYLNCFEKSKWIQTGTMVGCGRFNVRFNLCV